MDDSAPEMPILAIIWHSRTGACEGMARAVALGAQDHAILRQADKVTPDELIGSTGFVFVCPENLGSMSGLMKEMFDRCYYPLLGQIEGRAYATVIAAGSDGVGAEAQLDRIVRGWRLKRVADSIIVNFAAQTPEAILAGKVISPEVDQKCFDLGASLTEGMRCGIF